MNKVQQAIKLCFAEYKKEYGEDAVIEANEQYACVFNDAIITLSYDHTNKLTVEIFPGKPPVIDFSLDLAEELGEECFDT